jgi:hypothetical protein
VINVINKSLSSLLIEEKCVGFEVLRAIVMNYELLMSHAAAHWFLARPIFDPEDGGDTFLRKVGSHTNYTALYSRSWQHSR